jgi:hypothetical protein
MYIITLPFALVSFKNGATNAESDKGSEQIISTTASQLGVAYASVYAILGVEQCAIELEHPYGVTTSCLPMETYCNAVYTSVEELLSFHTSMHTDGWDLACEGIDPSIRESRAASGDQFSKEITQIRKISGLTPRISGANSFLSRSATKGPALVGGFGGLQ